MSLFATTKRRNPFGEERRPPLAFGGPAVRTRARPPPAAPVTPPRAKVTRRAPRSPFEASWARLKAGGADAGDGGGGDEMGDGSPEDSVTPPMHIGTPTQSRGFVGHGGGRKRVFGFTPPGSRGGGGGSGGGEGRPFVGSLERAFGYAAGDGRDGYDERGGVEDGESGGGMGGPGAVASGDMDDGTGSGQCSVCNDWCDAGACCYCEKPACAMCLRQCERCQGVFCSLCSTVNYDDRVDRDLCIPCNNGEGV